MPKNLGVPVPLRPCLLCYLCVPTSHPNTVNHAFSLENGRPAPTRRAFWSRCSQTSFMLLCWRRQGRSEWNLKIEFFLKPFQPCSVRCGVGEGAGEQAQRLLQHPSHRRQDGRQQGLATIPQHPHQCDSRCSVLKERSQSKKRCSNAQLCQGSKDARQQGLPQHTPEPISSIGCHLIESEITEKACSKPTAIHQRNPYVHDATELQSLARRATSPRESETGDRPAQRWHHSYRACFSAEKGNSGEQL